MRLAFVFILVLLAGCSAPKDYDKKIIGSWEVYKLNGETDLYKAFVGTMLTFNADGSFSKGTVSKKHVDGVYKIKGNTVSMEWNKKEHSSVISIKGTELSFEKDFSFSRGGVPMKSVYKKK